MTKLGGNFLSLPNKNNAAKAARDTFPTSFIQNS